MLQKKNLLTEKSDKTMKRILDSAEILFVEKGFNATSLRMITKAANVNLASVNYHFGNKETLIETVILRRFLPYLDEISKGLEKCASMGKLCTITDLIRSLINPIDSLINCTPKRSSYFIILIAKVFIEKPQLADNIIRNHHNNVMQQFRHLYREIHPELSSQDIHWRMYFTIKVLCGAYIVHDIIKPHNDRPEVIYDFREVSKKLIPFLTAALNAPAIGSTKEISKAG